MTDMADAVDMSDEAIERRYPGSHVISSDEIGFLHIEREPNRIWILVTVDKITKQTGLELAVAENSAQLQFIIGMKGKKVVVSFPLEEGLKQMSEGRVEPRE